MLRDLVPLFVGFVLTTVLGGLLGSYLQQRSWSHQNEARLREQGLTRAAAVCENVSQLLDKRLYRMTRLLHAVQGRRDGTVPEEQVHERWRDYDAVLFEWNDALNLNLALVGTYFGHGARAYLDRELYARFAAAGAALERAYRAARDREPEPPGLESLAAELRQLNHGNYDLGLFMMTALREGLVGRRATDRLEVPVLSNPHRSDGA
jgi:hypothetical protein